MEGVVTEKRKLSVRSRQREGTKKRLNAVEQRLRASDTVLDLWLVYGRTRFGEAFMNDPRQEGAVFKEIFYAGVASMMALMHKAEQSSGGDLDLGADQLRRVFEEVETFSKGLQ